MNCKDTGENLVAFIQNELTCDKALELQEHLTDCRECQLKYNQLLKATSTVRNSLHTLPKITDQRALIMARLKEQPSATAASSQRKNHCKNEVHWLNIYNIFRRSPYFAASMLVHVAAAVAIVVLVYNTKSEPKKYVTQYSETVNSYEYFIPERQERSSQWLMRHDKPFIKQKGVKAKNGISYNISSFNSSEKQLTLVDSPELGCIKAFRDGDKVIGRRVDVKDGWVVIPAELASVRLDPDLNTRIIDMDNHLEFWSESRWDYFSRQLISFLKDTVNYLTGRAV